MTVPAGAPSPGWRAWVLLAPLLAWVGIFVVAPAALLLVYSFCDRDELGRVVFDFSTAAYARVLDPIYLGIFARSLGYATATTVLCLVIGFPSRGGSPARRRRPAGGGCSS